MPLFPDNAASAWYSLGWPLLRLIISLGAGLFIASCIEALQWSKALAALARPLTRLGRLPQVAGASFSLAFFSSLTANTLLAEAYQRQEINRRQIILANLFNSLPTYFVHLPAMFFITVPILHGTALLYVGLTLLAALLRTVFIIALSRLTSNETEQSENNARPDRAEAIGWRQALKKAGQRFQRRIGKILLITIPIYLAVYGMHRAGIFAELEQGMAALLQFQPWLSPKSVGIIVLGMTAEVAAGVTVAGVILQEGSLPVREVVLALLVGNILSSPIRAVRHQYPYYAGIFQPRLAIVLIGWSQSLRVLSLLLVAIVYYQLAGSAR